MKMYLREECSQKDHGVDGGSISIPNLIEDEEEKSIPDDAKQVNERHHDPSMILHKYMHLTYIYSLENIFFY